MTRPSPTAHLACWLFPALKLTCTAPRGGNTLHGVPDLVTAVALLLLQGPFRLSSCLAWFLTTCPTRTPAGQVSASFPSPQNLLSFVHSHVQFFHMPGPMQHNLLQCSWLCHHHRLADLRSFLSQHTNTHMHSQTHTLTHVHAHTCTFTHSHMDHIVTCSLTLTHTLTHTHAHLHTHTLQ